jgi:hypothetical protein
MPATPTEAIVGRLTATTAVADRAAARVYPTLPTQDPGGDYVVVTKTAGGGGMRLASPTRANQYSMRVDCYSTTQAGAEALLAACVGGLAGWSDRANKVLGCFPTEDADEQVTDDAGGEVYRVSGQTFSLFFVG